MRRGIQFRCLRYNKCRIGWNIPKYLCTSTSEGVAQIPNELKTLAYSNPKQVANRIDDWKSMLSEEKILWASNDIVEFLKNLKIARSKRSIELLPYIESMIVAQNLGSQDELYKALSCVGAFGPQHEEVRSLLLTLVKLADSNDQNWSPSGTSSIVFNAMKPWSNEKGEGSREVNEIMDILTRRINSCSSHWSASDVSRSFFGLQNFSYLQGPSRFTFLLQALVEKLKLSEGSWIAENICYCFGGLKNMSNDDIEVRRVLSLLTNNLRQLEGHQILSMHQISVICNGFRCMTSNYIEVIDIIAILIPHIQGNTSPGTVTNMVNILYGLRGMSSEPKPVRQLLAALVPKILELEDPIDSQSLRNARYGLKSMNDIHPEVVNILAILGKVKL